MILHVCTSKIMVITARMILIYLPRFTSKSVMASIGLKGSSRECRNWLIDCLEVFPKVRRMRIEIISVYKKLPSNILGRARGKVVIRREVDPESLLLEGVADAKLKRVIEKTISIEINEELRKIGNQRMREQLVKSVIVH